MRVRGASFNKVCAEYYFFKVMYAHVIAFVTKYSILALVSSRICMYEVHLLAIPEFSGSAYTVTVRGSSDFLLAQFD